MSGPLMSYWVVMDIVFKWDLKRMRLIREGKTVLLFREIDSMCFIPEKQIPQIKNASAMWTIIMTKEKLCMD